MTNRREFLQIGLAAAALPIAQGLLYAEPVAAEVTGVPQSVPLYKAIFDSRYAEGRMFGDQAQRRGVSVLGFQGDVTNFWFNDLDLRWRNGREAIAGFTAHAALFVLERLAWDRGLKVVFRAEHHSLPGSIEHRLTCREPLTSLARPLANAGERWSQVMANIVTRCPVGAAESVAHQLVTPGDHRLPEDEPFFSWVIAPRA